jgi:peroxiredoxin
MIKKIVFLLVASIVFSTQTFAQEVKPSLGDPMPEFSIYTMKDSAEFKSSEIKKKGIVLIKVFSPDCEHCQEEAKKYVEKRDSLKNIRTIWISAKWTPMSAIEEFAEKYELKKLKPIAIGKEGGDFLLNFYGIDGIPYAALYIHDQLVFAQKGELNFEELIAIANGVYE